MKQPQNTAVLAGAAVAPHAGAWIETQPVENVEAAKASPPTRGRGLKQTNLDAVRLLSRRPPRGGVD